MPESAREGALRWKLEKDIETYQFYLDVSVKASIFLMAVTGGIASYVLSHTDTRAVAVSLLFPAFLNAGFAVFFAYSVEEARRIVEIHIDVSRALGLPEVNMRPLRAVCQLFCMMCAVAAIGLLVLMAYQLATIPSPTAETRSKANSSELMPNAGRCLMRFSEVSKPHPRGPQDSRGSAVNRAAHFLTVANADAISPSSRTAVGQASRDRAIDGHYEPKPQEQPQQ
jgi:hypothetical protein